MYTKKYKEDTRLAFSRTFLTDIHSYKYLKTCLKLAFSFAFSCYRVFHHMRSSINRQYAVLIYIRQIGTSCQ